MNKTNEPETIWSVSKLHAEGYEYSKGLQGYKARNAVSSQGVERPRLLLRNFGHMLYWHTTYSLSLLHSPSQ